MIYYTPFETALDAQSAFNSFVATHGGVNGTLAVNALGNAFAVEVYDEYADDRQRWTVALCTAKEYVDQGVDGY